MSVRPRTVTPERLRQRAVLCTAAQRLYTYWAQSETPPFLHSTDVHRLKHGTAGFGLVVKAATRLQLDVRLTFVPTEET